MGRRRRARARRDRLPADLRGGGEGGSQALLRRAGGTVHAHERARSRAPGVPLPAPAPV